MGRLWVVLQIRQLDARRHVPFALGAELSFLCARRSGGRLVLWVLGGSRALRSVTHYITTPHATRTQKQSLSRNRPALGNDSSQPSLDPAKGSHRVCNLAHHLEGCTRREGPLPIGGAENQNCCRVLLRLLARAPEVETAHPRHDQLHLRAGALQGREDRDARDRVELRASGSVDRVDRVMG